MQPQGIYVDQDGWNSMLSCVWQTIELVGQALSKSFGKFVILQNLQLAWQRKGFVPMTRESTQRMPSIDERLCTRSSLALLNHYPRFFLL